MKLFHLMNNIPLKLEILESGILILAKVHKLGTLIGTMVKTGFQISDKITNGGQVKVIELIIHIIRFIDKDMSMKKIVITTICMLFVLSLFAQSQISGPHWSSAMTDRDDKTEFVKTFYKEYITYLYTDEHKKDSLITQYCSVELKEIVQRTLREDDYNFLLDGWGGSDINSNSVQVSNLGDGEYNVSFVVEHHFGDTTVTVNLHVVVSDDRGNNAKIEQVIRLSDNYAVPSSISN